MRALGLDFLLDSGSWFYSAGLRARFIRGRARGFQIARGAGKGLGIAGLVTALVPGVILAVLTVSCTGCIGSLPL